MLKRLTASAVAVTMAFSMMAGPFGNAHASILNNTVLTASAANTLDYYSYKANYIKNYTTYDYLVDEMRLPYRDFVETLDKNKAFKAELAAWKVATITPDSAISDITRSYQFKYYEAIIIDMLVRDMQESGYAKKVKEMYDSVHASVWKDYVELNSDILKNTPITSENAAAILEELKDIYPAGTVLKRFTKIGGGIITSAKDIEDLLNKITQLQVIADLAEEYSEVLQIMANKCSDNVWLKAALEDVSQVFGEGITDDMITTVFTGEYLADKAVTYCFKEFKKGIVKKMGLTGEAIELGQSAGKAVADMWFGTGKMITDYYQMQALYDVEDLVRDTLSSTSGSTFCAAFKIYENICYLGCDYSTKYVKPIYNDSMFGQLFSWATNQNYAAYAQQLENIKAQLSSMFEMINVGADSWYILDSDLREEAAHVDPEYTPVEYTKSDYETKSNDLKNDVYSGYGGNNGCDMTLTKDIVINNSFDVTGGTVDLNGHTLTVNGDLNHSAGTIKINDGKLIVNGNYNGYDEQIDKYGDSTISQGGLLSMSGKNDYVLVEGNFIANHYYYSSYYSSYLSNGCIELKKDFIKMNYDDFRTSDNCKVIFSGTGKQRVESKNGYPVRFANVDFQNSKIEIDNNFYFDWNKLLSDTTIDGDLNLKLDGTLDLDGHTLTVNGDLNHSAGTIDINDGQLNVNGNYYGRTEVTDKYGDTTYSSGGRILMNDKNDSVNVKGDYVVYQGWYARDYLKNGITTVSGDFIQMNDSYSFCPGSDHKFVLNSTGDKKQRIEFKNTSSKFNILEIVKTKSGYEFPYMPCWNRLIMPEGSETDPQFVVSTEECMAGKIVKVKVSVKNNPGIISMKLDIDYDTDALTLIDAKAKDFVGTEFGPMYNEPFTMSWVDSLNGNNKKNGVIAELTFEVSEYADKDSYPIYVTYDDDNVFDNDYSDVFFGVKNGAINIVTQLFGDISDDGTINMKDLAALQRYLNGWEVEINEAAADLDSDDRITMKDLVALQRITNGWE